MIRVSILTVCLLAGLDASAAVAGEPYINGVFVTNAGPGTIRFVPQFGQGGAFQGTVFIDGSAYPGTLTEIPNTGSIGLAWVYPKTTKPAGSALLASNGGATYAGPIDFVNRQGKVSQTGVATVELVVK